MTTTWKRTLLSSAWKYIKLSRLFTLISALGLLVSLVEEAGVISWRVSLIVGSGGGAIGVDRAAPVVSELGFGNDSSLERTIYLISVRQVT